MNCVDEIISRLALRGGVTEDNLRIVLHDYDISKRSTSLIVSSADNRQKAVQMFVVAKKVEGCTERTIQYYIGTLRRFFNEMDCHLMCFSELRTLPHTKAVEELLNIKFKGVLEDA